MTSATKGIEVRAEVRQVKTMVDRSVNVTLNLPEDCIEQAKVLLDWLGLEIGVVMAVDPPQSRSISGGNARQKR